MPATGAPGVSFGGPLDIDGVIVDVLAGRRHRGSTPNGRVIYVCSIGGKGAGHGNGSKPDAPLATVGGTNGALAKLANPTARTFKGDTIVCLPGHVESVSSADYFSDMATASHFSIVGLGMGAARPTFNWTTATSTVLMDQAGFEWVNCNLNLCGNTATGALTVATPITVSAAGCRIADCEINWGQDTDTGCGSTLGAIAVVAGTRFRFENNYCPNLDTAGTLAVSFLSLNGADDAIISGNTIYGGTTVNTVGAIHCVTTASKRIQIVGNVIENLRATSTKAVTSAIASVTGTIANNLARVQSGIVAYTVSGTPFLCTFFNNYTSNTDTKNGALDVGAGTSV